LPFPLAIVGLARRFLDEEKLLAEELSGSRQ
jgi:hypothetical protein